MSANKSVLLKNLLAVPAVGVAALAALAPALLWHPRTLALGAIATARLVTTVAAYGLAHWYEILRGLCL
jgi:hypothetical protein